MSQQTQPNAPVRRSALKAAAVGALFVFSCAMSILMPPFALLTVVLCCTLLKGGRARFCIALFAVGFAAQVLITGSFLFSALYLLFALICSLPPLVFHKRFSHRPHFDGVIVQCASVALSFAAMYGIAYLLLGGEPIHAICSALETVLFADSSQSASELLRLTWQMKQVMLYSQSEQGLTTAAVLELIQEASALTHAQLVSQTTGFFEIMTRNALPTIVVLTSSLGGLLFYVLPARWLSNPSHGIGRFLSLRTKPSRPLPAFSLWQLPRDIGAGLFIAVLLLLVLSFAGVSALDGAMVLVYTLFSAVFYVQGLCCVSYLFNLTKMKRPVKIVLTCVAAIFTSIVSMLGTVDYVVRLRSFMDFSRKMKKAVSSGVSAAAWRQNTQDEDTDADEDQDEDAHSDDASNDASDASNDASQKEDLSDPKQDDTSNSAQDAANKED